MPSKLVLEDVLGEALGDALGGRAEGGVRDLDAVLDEARHGAAAAELAIVGVRCQDEHVVEALDAHGEDSPLVRRS
jgi:hypothetical protein